MVQIEYHCTKKIRLGYLLPYLPRFTFMLKGEQRIPFFNNRDIGQRALGYKFWTQWVIFADREKPGQHPHGHVATMEPRQG